MSRWQGPNFALSLPKVHPWIVGGFLLLLLALAIGQSIVTHGRELAQAAERTRILEQAQAKARAVQEKLANDQKLEEACWAGPPRSVDEIINTCVKPLADKGNAAAQRSFAYYLFNRIDFSGAIAWFERAANQGDSEAMIGLAFADPAKQVFWYTKSAERGNVRAMEELGDIYRHGVFAPQNYTEALTWYGRAAEAGDAFSLFALGEMYRNGEGISVNKIEAYKWFSVACAESKGSRGCDERDDTADTAPRMSAADMLKGQQLAAAWHSQFRR